MDEDLQQRLLACTGFAWDEGNRDKNRVKHQVSNWECEQVFFNRPLVTACDARHSLTEDRYYALGVTDLGKRLFIAFTVREYKIRVISARDMSRKERGIYEASP